MKIRLRSNDIEDESHLIVPGTWVLNAGDTIDVELGSGQCGFLKIDEQISPNVWRLRRLRSETQWAAFRIDPDAVNESRSWYGPRLELSSSVG